MAMSADESIAVTGAKSGAKLNLVPAAACAAAAEVTKLSVSTSPVATRLNDRGGVVRRTAARVAVVAGDSVTPAAAVPTAVSAHANKLDDTHRATRLVTASTSSGHAGVMLAFTRKRLVGS